MDCLRNVQAHLHGASRRDQWNATISRQFLSDRFAVAHEQSKNRRIGASLATNALGNFRHRNCSKWRFFRSFPNCRVAADGGEGCVPRPDRDRKIESADDRDNAEGMPLLMQTVT